MNIHFIRLIFCPNTLCSAFLNTCSTYLSVGKFRLCKIELSNEEWGMISNKTKQNLLVTVGGESLSGGVSNKASFTFNSSLLLKDYSLTHNAVLKLLDLDVGRNVIRDQIENFCWF